IDHRTGEMAEWLKAHAWKACRGETPSRVRIPVSPPLKINNLQAFVGNGFGELHASPHFPPKPVIRSEGVRPRFPLRSRYVNLRYLLPTFCGLDAKPDRVECWKEYQGQEGSHCRSADQCIGERSPKCREREWDEGQDRGQCRQHNRSRTLDCRLHQSVERIEAVIAI